jgi:hypothetical protein
MHNTKSFKSFKKSPYFSTKHSTYFDVYDLLLQKYQDKPITFVEVGIWGGGSLFMWRDFFGPKARIIGIDLNPAAIKWEKEGFEIFIGNQSDPAFWESFKAKVGPVDVLLDDGGHTYVQQIITMESMIDQINDDGILIVEDTHTSYMARFGDKKISFSNYAKSWIDRLNARFSAFKDDGKDTRVHSMEVFESIIAFKVNRKASSLPSTVTSNDGEFDNAKHFRYEDDAFLKQNQSSIKKIIQRAFSIIDREK